MDEDDTGIDHDEDEIIASLTTGRKNNKWFLIAGVAKLAADISASFQDFFEVNYIGATQRFAWETQRQENLEAASRELEAMGAVDMEKLTRSLISDMGWEVEDEEE